jgi:predicted MFS family arabinose efflux permease
MNTVWKKDMIADVASLVIGLGLCCSPWAVGFSAESPMNWNAWLSGIMIAALAVAALAVFAEWPEWLTLAAGVWVAVSPWVLHFSSNATHRSTSSPESWWRLLRLCDSGICTRAIPA